MIKLTQEGLKRASQYIAELKSKRDFILRLKSDTAEHTVLPTIKDIEADINFFGLMDCGKDGSCYLNGWDATDNISAEYPLLLKLGRDLEVVQ